MSDEERQEHHNQVTLENLEKEEKRQENAAREILGSAHHNVFNATSHETHRRHENLPHMNDSHSEDGDNMPRLPSAPEFAPKDKDYGAHSETHDEDGLHVMNAEKALRTEAQTESAKGTGLTNWYVNREIESSVEKSLMGKDHEHSGKGKSYKKANAVDKLSSEINSALTDPIHAVPLVTYDKNFEPIGRVETEGLEKWTHFANRYADHSYLRSTGPNYPGGLNTMGKIISGCHNKINQCVMHCRMEFSYIKKKDFLTGMDSYWTANQHGTFEKTNESRYNEFMGKVKDCSVQCLSKHKCIHDISFLHRHYNGVCYGLLDMCAKPHNCKGYNNFTCMSNCSGDLCYPLYRFVQDIKDFKRQVISKVKLAAKVHDYHQEEKRKVKQYLGVELGRELGHAQRMKRHMEVGWKKSKQQMRQFKGAVSKILTHSEKLELEKIKTQDRADKHKHDELKVKMSGQIALAKKQERQEIRKIKDHARAQVATETSREVVQRKEMKGIESPGEIHRKAKREVTAIKEERDDKIKMAKKEFKQAKELVKVQAYAE